MSKSVYQFQKWQHYRAVLNLYQNANLLERLGQLSLRLSIRNRATEQGSHAEFFKAAH